MMTISHFGAEGATFFLMVSPYVLYNSWNAKKSYDRTLIILELLHFMGGMNVVRGRKIFFLENDPLVVKFYGELEKNIFEA